MKVPRSHSETKPSDPLTLNPRRLPRTRQDVKTPRFCPQWRFSLPAWRLLRSWPSRDGQAQGGSRELRLGPLLLRIAKLARYAGGSLQTYGVLRQSSVFPVQQHGMRCLMKDSPWQLIRGAREPRRVSKQAPHYLSFLLNPASRSLQICQTLWSPQCHFSFASHIPQPPNALQLPRAHPPKPL